MEIDISLAQPQVSDKDKTEKVDKADKVEGSPSKSTAKVVPEESMSYLTELIVQDSGSLSIKNVTDKYQNKYPNVSKRQIEFKLSEISFRDKVGFSFLSFLFFSFLFFSFLFFSFFKTQIK
jgi:hypothetical protein